MPEIFRYAPIIEPGPAGRTVRHTNTEDGDVLFLCEMDGYAYISVPDGITLPEQHPDLVLEPVVLTDELRRRLKAAARPVLMSKLATRARVRAVSGDAEDQIADLERRVAMAERLLYRLAAPLLSGDAIPPEVAAEYLAPVQEYLAAVDGGLVKTRSDAEFVAEVMPVLMARSTAVTDAVIDHITEIDRVLPLPAA